MSRFRPATRALASALMRITGGGFVQASIQHLTDIAILVSLAAILIRGIAVA